MSDLRQRFFIQNQPVRGDVVLLENSLQTILKQKEYPQAIQLLLGEMLAAAALLVATFKIQGRLSIQAQGSGALTWAMAECSHTGEVRALAKWQDEESETWNNIKTADEAFSQIKQGVLFVNIEPEKGERYQGIVELKSNMSSSLTAYYQQSAQLATIIKLAATTQAAGGLLLQLLPHKEDEIEEDLWDRLTALSATMTTAELSTLPANELLYRLFHEEEVVLADPNAITFGCTCTEEKCENALQQVNYEELLEILTEVGEINMDCQFCQTQYRFNAEQIAKIHQKQLH